MSPSLKYQIALTMIKGVGSLTARKLVAALGDEESVFKTSHQDLERIPGIGKVLAQQIKEPCLLEKAERELAYIEKHGIKVFYYLDSSYPTRLKECEDQPILLYGKGNLDLNRKRCIGIVGTRKMTSYGRVKCEEIVSELAGKYPELLVVSGLAYGVDGCAHKKSLEEGIQTVGVVGHGLDTIYPAEHRQLAERMTANGGMLTEFPSHSPIDRKNFVSRNRIIAGLCDVILVVESGEKGGALLTADFAISYNRDVCAIPGRVGDAYSVGCNNLIKRNSAAMIESALDIEQLMNWEIQEKKSPMQMSLFMDLTESERLVVDVLQMEEKMQINQLARKLQMPVGQLSSILFEMEMKDLLLTSPGGVYSLR